MQSVSASPARHGNDRPVILCALEFERAVMLRAGLDQRADIICCGPGAEAVVQWSEREGMERRNIVLAGLAGGLRESAIAGRAYLAATIIAPSGRQYRSAFAIELCSSVQRDVREPLRSAIIASVDHVVTARAAKRAIAEKTSAEVIDMESAVFAEAATIFGWRWAVVRGISDDCGDSLPWGIERWVDARGRTRTLRAILSILRRPWILPAVLRLRRNSRAAMASAAEGLRVILDAMEPVAVDPSEEVKPEATVLIFGGTFDPPHRAHVEIPQHVAETTGCDEILYVPTSANPLKDEQPAPAHHRLEMLRLALRDCPRCSISTIEIDQTGPSYTVETLQRLRDQHGSNARFRLLLGADSVLDFHRWKEPRRILELATPVVVLRPPLTREHLRSALESHWSKDEVEQWMSWIVDAPELDISARDLRALIPAGQGALNAIDSRVFAYIREHGLYHASARV